MVKRTIVFSNPAYLHTKQNQLVISRAEQNDTTIPIEDIGIVLCDHDQIRITKTLLAKLLENNAAVVITDGKHLPAGLFLPLDANILQQERFTEQVGAPVPVRKRLWKQTVLAKIRNQALILKKFGMENAPSVRTVTKSTFRRPGKHRGGCSTAVLETFVFRTEIQEETLWRSPEQLAQLRICRFTGTAGAEPYWRRPSSAYRDTPQEPV